MSKWIDFNINEKVRVKLTERGIAELIRQADALGVKYHPRHQDENGYSEWQLWELMSELGHVITMFDEVPFETAIQIDVKDEPQSD